MLAPFFARIFGEYVQIFRYFARTFDKSKLLGMRFDPYTTVSMDGFIVNYTFSNKYEKAKKTNFKTDLVNMGSCSFHTLCNAFSRKSSVAWIADF